MSIQQLSADLSSLSADCKRKAHDVKQACEKALAELKSYPPTESVTSLPVDTRKDITSPFLLACSSGNSKLVLLAIPLLNKWITLELVPNEAVDSVLTSLNAALSIADTELRILQCLPVLAQGHDLHGPSLVKLITLCASLASNRSPVVENTASATLQQLFGGVFDKLKDNSDPDPENLAEAVDVFTDLCRFVTGEKLTYVRDASIKQLSVLEIIESIIANHAGAFERPELTHILKERLVPALVNILNSPNSFPLVTRTVRIIYVLLSTQLDTLEEECEIVLSISNHILVNTDVGNLDLVNWEKILMLEMFKNLTADFSTIRSIFQHYDNNPKKKNVIQELMSILSTYIEKNSTIVNDTVCPSDTSPGSIFLSLQYSTMKVPLLDHLDKHDPPQTIPNTYSIYLTLKILNNYADGIALYVNEFSQYKDASAIEDNLEFISNLLEVCFPDTLLLFQHFLYSSMDNETFHSVVRSLQKFTHTAGLLGLTLLRDSLLSMLSEATTKNLFRLKKNSTSFQEQGKQLLSFGESLVESLSSAIQAPASPNPSGTTSPVKHEEPEQTLSRNFNSRQVVCLRALTNLAVSLGSTLQGSWKILWSTFQLVNFYLHGPDEYSGFQNHKGFKNLPESLLPSVSQQDINNIGTSFSKFLASINEYPTESFYNLLLMLTEMYSDPTLCPYNKSFFLDMILQVSKVNATKFLIGNEKTWSHLIKFFVETGNKRDSSHVLRVHLTKCFNQVILDVSVQGFESKDLGIELTTSRITLDALIEFLNNMFEKGLPSELMVLNCETEMHLLVLETLHDLIDRYDTYYQDSWNVVFKILNTSFKFDASDKKLTTKVQSLIQLSFDTLKLILDEFLLSLPFKQLKYLIDTLYNFCSQTYDLNISFTSVSYFWLISDAVKSRMQDQDVDYDKIKNLKSNQLDQFLEDATEGTTLEYKMLDIYLLCSLAKLCSDIRPQVRDGAIQTIFKIIDVHGSIIPSWDLFSDTVLSLLLDLRPLRETVISDSDQKELVDSLSLMLSGLLSMYSKFIVNFDDVERQDLKVGTNLTLWRILIKYFSELLEFKWNDLNLKVFKFFQDLIAPFVSKEDTDSEIRRLFYDLWSNVNVEYDFIHPEYQDTLANYVHCFQSLYRIVHPIFGPEECTKTLSILNTSARYPILPPGVNDEKKPSALQKAVLDSLQTMSEYANPAVKSGVIQQLSLIIIYPFATRERIENKLHGKIKDHRFRIPTFTAISHMALLLLKKNIDECDILVLTEDRSIEKLLISLLEIIQTKSVGIATKPPLWVEANEIFEAVTTRLLKEVDIKDKTELWKLLIGGVNMCIAPGKTEHQMTNILQYYLLSLKVIPALEKANQKELIGELVLKIYSNSFLYMLNDIEEHLMDKNFDTTVKRLVNFPFDDSFGSSKDIEPYSNVDTRLLCLRELGRFVTCDSEIQKVASTFFVTRLAYSLRRYIADAKLIYKAPLPRIQEEEIAILLQQLIAAYNQPEMVSELRKIEPLVIKMVPHAEKGRLGMLLQKALSERNHKATK